MKYALFLLSIIFLQSCAEKQEVSQESGNEVVTEIDTVKTVSTEKVPVQNDSLNEVMLVEDINFNGKINRFFRIADFEKTFGKPDSTKLMSEEEPCSYVFENPDGSKD